MLWSLVRDKAATTSVLFLASACCVAVDVVNQWCSRSLETFVLTSSKLRNHVLFVMQQNLMAFGCHQSYVTAGPYAKVHWERNDIALQAIVELQA